RLRFVEQESGWQAEFGVVAAQELLRQQSFADEGEWAAQAEALQRSLDLAQGPVLRALLGTQPDGSQRLLLVVHHLVVDGVSWRMLLEDLQHAYRAALARQLIALPAKTSAFKTWGECLQRYAEGVALRQELGYWVAQPEGLAVDLPCRNPQGNQQLASAMRASCRLDAMYTRQLLQEAPAAYRTQVNDLLLTVLARVIGRWLAQSEVLVQLEGHGREDMFADLDVSRTLGWFTSVYPVRLSPQKSVGASIKTIKEQLRGVPNKGLGYGVLRYLGDPSTRALLQALPQPRISFNYLGQFDGSFAADESLFGPLAGERGREQSPQAPLGNWLTLNGSVYGGQLSLDWVFSQEVFDAEEVQALADDYAAELRLLIEHCVAQENQGFTPSDFPLVSVSQAQLDSLPLSPRQVSDLYPLTPLQQGILFHAVHDGGSGDYVNQARFELIGLDVERFRQAWQGAVADYEILRSVFLLQPGMREPLQAVMKQVSLPFLQLDWSDRADAGVALDELAMQERAQCFRLGGAAPLIRFAVVRVALDRHQVIYTSHHILVDGWSGARLLGEVMSRYVGIDVSIENGRYGDFVAWLQRQDRPAAEQFWGAQVKRLDGPTLLTRQLARVTDVAPTAPSRNHLMSLDAEAVSRLKAFAGRHKVTVNTLVQGAWALLAGFHAQRATVAFGATASERPAEIPAVEQRVGLFINTLPLVVELDPESAIGAWLAGLQAHNLEARRYAYLGLADVQHLAGRRELFDSVVIFENYPSADVLHEKASGLTLTQYAYHEQTNYPLTLYVTLKDRLSLDFSYKPWLCEAAVTLLATQLARLLEQMTALDGQSPLAALQSVLLQWEPTKWVFLEDGMEQGTRARHAPADYAAAETPLQERLVAIWQSVLGVERVGIDDDFFELGGTSITAMVILAWVNDGAQEASRVTPQALFENTTIRSMAATMG
ncbi:condensation domain-containing protein, partial [Pseudomonas lopnurensis]|uniref:condensation domain-containing protein n=1 Tax=Pseudomonas lopnurensis TaxID=1477517 RepID=UPI001F334089